MDRELLEVLEGIRKIFGRPILINSWCRCEAYNAHIGGKPGSYHVKGMAADIRIEEIPASLVADYLDRTYPDRYGIGRYDRFTHIDVRHQRSRWDKTTKRPAWDEVDD